MNELYFFAWCFALLTIIFFIKLYDSVNKSIKNTSEICALLLICIILTIITTLLIF